MKFSKDLLERAARAFAGAFLTAFAAGLVTATTLPGLKALAIGAGTAGISAVFSIVATQVGDQGTASFVKAASSIDRGTV